MTGSLGLRVVSAGLLTLDVVQVVDRLPRPDEKVVATRLSVDYGGPAANAAGVARALGAEATLVSVIGRSVTGELARRLLEMDGVRCVDLAPNSEIPLAVSTVLVDAASGERAVASTNATGVPVEPGVSALPAELPATDVLLVDGHHLPLCLQLARQANARGIPVVFDGGSWKAGTDELLACVDIAVLSADFRRPDGRDPLTAVLAGRTRWAAQSHGAQPLVLRTRSGRASVVPPRVEIVDTLGAGDVLHGALTVAVALLGAQEAQAAQVLTFAARLASISCRAAGARGWQRDEALRAESEDLLRALAQFRRS